jgi:hypothetical protein
VIGNGHTAWKKYKALESSRMSGLKRGGLQAAIRRHEEQTANDPEYKKKLMAPPLQSELKGNR